MTRTWLIWFLVGLSMAALLQWHQMEVMQTGLAGALRVGSTSPGRSTIEAELGSVPLARGAGHDGQYNYLIARDPLAQRGTGDLLDHGGYRFRRILYPLLAGGFGLLPPRATMFGMVAWAAIGLGLAAAACRALASHLQARWWTTLGILANPGMWLSVQLVTADSLGFGLALIGIVLWIRRRWTWAILMLTLAVLTKDQFVLVAFSLSAWSWFRGHRLEAALGGLVPAGALVSWAGLVSGLVGAGFSPRPNFAAPLSGIIQLAATWPEAQMVDLVHSGYVLLGLAGCLVTILWYRHPLLIWLAAPWLLLALVTSDLVWAEPNNAARVLAPVWVWAALGLGMAVQRSQTAPSPRIASLPATGELR